jgi:hypothetical protein
LLIHVPVSIHETSTCCAKNFVGHSDFIFTAATQSASTKLYGALITDFRSYTSKFQQVLTTIREISRAFASVKNRISRPVYAVQSCRDCAGLQCPVDFARVFALATQVGLCMRTLLDILCNAGLFHTCAISTLGELLCWGDNRSGQLGNWVAGEPSYTRKVCASCVVQACKNGLIFLPL